MKIEKIDCGEGLILEGDIRCPNYMGYNHSLYEFFGYFVDGKLKLAVNRQEVKKIYYQEEL